VPAEWRYAEVLSCFNAYMDADALGLSAMANASIYRLFPLASVYPQVKPTIDSLRARGLVLPDGRVAPRSYVAIYGGDYDSAAWLYQRLPDIWSDPARGKVPIGWAFNPNLAERAAPMMAYARRSATPADVFIAGDNGAGYLNPSYLVPPRPWSGLPSGLAAWEAHCRRFFRQWGLSLTGFLIDGNARPSAGQVLDAYGRFSPDGVIGQKTPRLGMHASMPLLRMEWDLYDAAKGAEVIASRTRAAKPEFFMYRTILWSPTDLKRMVDLVKSGPAGRDVEFVDPHTLMLLVKQFHAGPDAGKTRPVKPIIPRPGERGSLWDVRRGLEVTGHSGIVDGCDPRDMFGGTYGSLEDHATVLFADGTDAGTLHWIEWRLPFKMSLEEVRLQAHGDDNGSTNREFDEVRLSARVGGAWRQVGMVRPSHPFTFVNRDTATMWTLRLPSPVTASEFRAEFTQHAAPGLPNMGPRIREVIGIGVAAP
jgi:hypothetical protein